jgi:hypothetical protein
MANSPIEDTTDLTNQPNSLIIGRYRAAAVVAVAAPALVVFNVAALVVVVALVAAAATATVYINDAVSSPKLTSFFTLFTILLHLLFSPTPLLTISSLITSISPPSDITFSHLFLPPLPQILFLSHGS